MPRAKPFVAAMGDSVDDIEAKFYEALQQGDLDKLMACWADDEDIFCVHPGAARLIGPEAIRMAYENLFAHAGSLNVQAHRVRKIEAMGSEIRSVIERLFIMTPDGQHEAHVLATNVYMKTVQGWRMVVHHVSPGSPHEQDDASDMPPVLH
jgi:ketosteroid isomerase-like protein